MHDLPFPPVEEPLESESGSLPADGYAAVHRGERVLLLRDQHPLPKKHAEDLTPQARDLEILRALWRFRFLLTSQIADEWWPGCSLYAAQRRLLRMTAAGWVTRFRPRLSKGKHEWIYQLDKKGFELAKTSWGLDGRYIEEDAKWRPRNVREYSVVEHDLQVNAWVRAYRKLAGDRVIDWLGPDQGRIDVPTVYDSHARRFRKVGIDDTTRGWENYRRARDFRLRDFAPLFPDATITIYSEGLGKELDLLIELDRTRRATKNVDKLHRYDAFLTAWCRLADRYRRGAVLPIVVFVCPSEQHAKSLMQVADRQVTGRVTRGGERPEEWPYPGRERILFCAEEDIHVGFGLAWSLPRQAASERDTDYFWAVDTELPLGR